MKINCDRFSDWLSKKSWERYARKLREAEAAKKARLEWHPHFVIYKKLAHGDCRLFETLERREVVKYRTEWVAGIGDFRCAYTCWEYRERGTS